MASPPPSKLDRETNTPFLLRLFYRNGAFHNPSDFSPTSELPPHVQIYTWPSCTLRELSHLLTSALPSLLPEPAIGTRLSYRLLYPDTRSTGSGSAPGPPKYVTKELGSVIIGEGGPGILPDEEETGIARGGQMTGPLGGEPEKTLQDARFVIGDYVCCAIVPPMDNGRVGPPPTGPSRSDFGGGEGVFEEEEGILDKSTCLLGSGGEESQYRKVQQVEGVEAGALAGDLEEALVEAKGEGIEK
ncbi:uncharacterized protein L3040_007170 [Drepanopeziza brunnea f. sp. 'multigermtubi']|uniref:uncharacterized protein n=1 Tax=Drepanopeziza brunnea f. sp. 'multigermtubi' TaxID=698441 RepID=UPI002384154E|nr:hypothetical protein L3040_007170 [Drepanopeziza brunnea f. sp. 'multigermtubi']